MKIKKHFIIYIFLFLLMILDVYSIFNAGNPDSIFRYLIKDSGWDYIITAVISILIILLVTLLNSQNRSVNDPIYLALQANKSYVKELREKGKTDSEIALSFAGELNENKLAQKVAYKKALKYMKR
ncbi:MAG: hypothetical protein PQJ46_03730, partial [Spirochaetales bacterium]|nr:hypothetical protein [Spirochaetales bacterium]